MKITNFEFGSIKLEKEKAVIQIPRTQFRYENISELKKSYDTDNGKDFLTLVNLEENGSKDRVILEYELPNDLKTVQKIKNEDIIVRLSIAKVILERAPLEENDNYVSLHPSTLFYRPMSTVKFTYKANSLMPSENQFSDFERYKALTLSIISGLSYEVCLKDKQRIMKTKDPLLLSILETKSKEELLSDLENQIDYMQYTFFERSKQQRKKVKFRSFAFAGLMVILLLVSVGLTKTLANKEYAQTVASYEEKIDSQEDDFRTQEYLVKNEYDKAASSMEEAGRSKKEIAEMYLDAGEYQKALDRDSDLLEKVIQSLYDSGEKEKILDLKLKDNPKLNLEKKIVAYDFGEMKNQIPFVEDEKQAVRMGATFAERGDINEAQMLLERFENEELKKVITLESKKAELKKNQEELKTLQEEIKKEEDDQKKKDKKNQEKTIKDNISTLEKDIEELK